MIIIIISFALCLLLYKSKNKLSIVKEIPISNVWFFTSFISHLKTWWFIETIHLKKNLNSNWSVIYDSIGFKLFKYLIKIFFVVRFRCDASHHNKWYKVGETVLAEFSWWSDKATKFNKKKTRRSITVSEFFYCFIYFLLISFVFILHFWLHVTLWEFVDWADSFVWHFNSPFVMKRHRL